MTITLDVPDELVGQLIDGPDLSRGALEALAVEAYRAHRLTGHQLRLLLGIATDYELDGFLQSRGVWLDYTLADFDREGELSQKIIERRKREGQETLHLLSIPGMRESIREGMQTPVEDCHKELDWCADGRLSTYPCL